MDKKKTIQIVIGVIAFLVLGCVYFLRNDRSDSHTVLTEDFADNRREENSTEVVEGTAPEAPPPGEESIYIHICGEVKKPGVYTFDRAPRVVEVVERAGGFTEKARQDCVNMAESVADGTQLVIEAVGKKSKDEETEQRTPDKVGSNKVNINTASKEELMTLSGIGESKATQILSYRESNGKFSKIEDIMNISGIKDGIFSKIKDYIAV